MKYHLTRDETWMRCRAQKRTGRGVSLCPIGELSHVVGRQGIAAQGGGIESRTENGERIEIRVSELADDGTFTVTSPKGFKRVYSADGTLRKLRDRAKAERVEANTVEPVSLDDNVDAESVEAKREWANELSVGGLKLWSLGDAAIGADLPRLAELSGLPLKKLEGEADFMGFTREQYADMLVSAVTTAIDKAANRAAVAIRVAHIELMSEITDVHVAPDVVPEDD